MQACLQRIVLENLLYAIQVCFFKTMIEGDSQLLFYKPLFYYFEMISFKTLILALLCKQSPFGLIRNYFGKLVLY
jgi:hypothetical protein